jgi:Putative adhesin
LSKKGKQEQLKISAMKIRICAVIIMTAAIAWGNASAQEFKLAKTSGRLEVNIGKATIEGYNGNEIIFTSNKQRGDDDDRSKGLTAISGSGLVDNTGLGINVTDKGTTISVLQLKKTNSPEIKIMVPKGITVYYSFESEYGGELKLKNIESEIEVSVNYNSVSLENVTGPATIKTVYGHVEADFSANMKDPISIVSIYGYADVTLPLATKANVRLSTSYGELLVAPEFKLDLDKQGELQDFNDKVSGKLNGGGLKIDISSSYGKVYLRKK